MNRLSAVLFAFLQSLAPASAGAPPVCTGTDLLAKLATEQATQYEAVLSQAAAIPNGEAILWRIERGGLEASFLLGTAHVTDPRVTNLSAAAASALAGAATVALELKELADPKELAIASMRQARYMVMPPGQSLWDLIPDADEPMIRVNASLPRGAVNTLFGYQPWVVAAMLSIPSCEMARKNAGIASVDEAIAQRAQQQGTGIVGLETVEEQLAVLAAMPLDLQAKYLLSVARLGPRTADYFETLVSLYDKRRVTAYMPLMLQVEPTDKDGEAMMAYFETDLIRKRNATMMRRAADLLAKGGAFIAVGALHLPGRDGLVELIRKAGYTVTPVN